MGLYASWNHGNALTVENPENLTQIKHFGWGTQTAIAASRSSWFHIPIPTPVLVNGVQSQLIRCFLLFGTVSGSIRNVHIYDGRGMVQEFNNLSLTGTHYDGVDTTNTFELANPHSVFLGIGISFFFQADTFTGGPVGGMATPQLTITSAGGDFTL